LSQLIIALDTEYADQALEWISETRDSCSIYKIGWQFFFSQGVRGIYQLSAKYPDIGFMFDTKFWDTTNTIDKVLEQLMRVSAIAMFTIHHNSVPNPIHEAIRKKLLAVIDLTSQQLDQDKFTINNKITPILDLIVGAVCSGQQATVMRQALNTSLKSIVCPGLAMHKNDLRDHKQATLLEEAHKLREIVDYWVVGRPIINADDPGAAARRIVQKIN
jgi:orotidine-5'-phosphate decarboxylase